MKIHGSTGPTKHEPINGGYGPSWAREEVQRKPIPITTTWVVDIAAHHRPKEVVPGWEGGEPWWLAVAAGRQSSGASAPMLGDSPGSSQRVRREKGEDMG